MEVPDPAQPLDVSSSLLGGEERVSLGAPLLNEEGLASHEHPLLDGAGISSLGKMESNFLQEHEVTE